jgi:hypothetical protein
MGPHVKKMFPPVSGVRSFVVVVVVVVVVRPSVG